MDWFTTLEKIGLPGFILVLLLIGLWKSFVWASSNILLPLTERHISFLDKLEKNFDQIDTAIQKIAECQQRMVTKIVCLNPKENILND
jgi:hypothetical protein